jgi:ABC-type polysaccharide/polyol phosphate transport system ATPase subunit
VIVEVRDLGVRFTFDRQGRPITTGAARLRRHTYSRFGLRAVNFSVGPGESVALIGPNGAGKTTLLRALAGVYEADEGEVTARGRVGPLLSVNGGLIPMLTGREACAHLAVLTGTEAARVRAEVEAIREVSELGDSFDDLVSSYSQGMRARLAFATVTERRPDLLLLDEVHQAFDSEFRATVVAEAQRIRDRGGCVLAAGHDSQALGRLCDRAIHLHDGRLIADGPFDEVVEAYESAVHAS